MKIAPEINRVTLAVLIGYSPKQITRWLSDTDIPHERRGTEVLFPWPGTRVWLHKYLEEKGKRAGRPESRDDARNRQRAQAEKRDPLPGIFVDDDPARIVVDARRLDSPDSPDDGQQGDPQQKPG